MIEAAFPLLGAAIVFFVVLPAAALATKALLVIAERSPHGGPLHNLPLRYAFLLGSSALPFVWLISAGLHQAEQGRSDAACLFDHPEGGCAEPALFAAILLAVIVAACARGFRRADRPTLSSAPAARAVLARVERLLALDPALRPLRHRVDITEDPRFALGTRGLIRPRVILGGAFAARLSDEMLASALSHEHAHVRGLDPLRYFALHAAMALNPIGALLLGPHLRSWIAAREAHCDREAVLRGASPLPLADALLRAARPTPPGTAALGAADTSILKLRVSLLLAFAERAPSACCRPRPSILPAALALVAAASFLPHHTGTRAIDLLHQSAEHALSNLLP